MTKFRSHLPLIVCATAFALSASATGAAAEGPTILADELSVTGTVTPGGAQDLPDPPIAQKGHSSPRSARGEWLTGLSFKHEIKSPRDGASGQSATGQGRTRTSLKAK